MFKRNTLGLGGAALCGTLLVSGCANHMSQRSEHEERVERKLLDHSLQIDVGEPKVLELPQRRVKIHEQKSFEVTEFEVTRHYDRYTPYQPWREVYEIPLGMVAVVAGVGANVVNVFALGNLPDSVTKDWLSYGFAGINPFMNVQSHGRAQQNLAGIDEVQLDKRTEYSSLPWSERPVQVKAGKETFELNTDKNGVLRLNLLDSPFAEHDINHLSRLLITVADAQDDVHTDSSLAVSSGLRGKLLDHSLQIDVGEPKVLELPQRRVRIHEQKTFEVTEFEVTRRYDRYTPYQPWREAYEIPLGAVAVVAGVGANVVNVFALGSLPDSVTKDWISYGFAGLNPFMNVQSHGRAQQNLAGIDEVEREKRTEYSSLPWSERPVEVKTGKQTFELTTDRNGVLRLNLLDSPFSEHDLSHISKLQISVADAQDDVHTDSSLAISGNLRGKLLEAHELIYDDLEDDEVSQWVHRVKRLSELGLEEEASELEQSLIELTRHDPELQQEFLQSLLKSAGRVAADPGGND